MATLAPAPIVAIYPPLERKYGKTVVRRGGIVGDLAHRQRGGFHISRQDQPGSNYSVQGFNKNGPSNWAAAIDITTNQTLMRLFSARLRAAVDRRDPRVMQVLFEWFGTLNGSTVTGDLLYDTRNRPAGRTSSDGSHLWHNHDSFRRDRITMTAMLAFADVLMGVPMPEPKPTDQLDEEVEMATVRDVLFAQVIPNPRPDAPKDDQFVSLADLGVMAYRAARNAWEGTVKTRDQLKEQTTAINQRLARLEQKVDQRPSA